MLRRFIKNIAVVILLFFIFLVFITAAAAEESIIPDSALQQALLGIIESGEINADALGTLSGSLDFSGLGIEDITGLEYLTGIESLDLSDNSITGIGPLGSLSNLSFLDIRNNYIDISDGSDAMAVIETLSGCEVLYSPQKPDLRDIALPETLEMCPGDVYAFECAGTEGLVWHSDNTDAAAVEDGTVTAVSEGCAVITASAPDDSFEASCTVYVKSAAISSDGYDIGSDDIIRGIGRNTYSNQFFACLNADEADLKLYTKDNKLFTAADKPVCTGMSVELVIGGTLRDKLNIIVEGDSNGDGRVDISDYTLARLDILRLKELKGIFKTAVDVDKDGEITISDYTQVRLCILGLKRVGGFMPQLPAIKNKKIKKYVDTAFAQMGAPYVGGMEGPSEYDCSGLVHYCLNKAGYKIGRCSANTYSKYPYWKYVEKQNLLPGDLMFFWSSDLSKIGHVGIYLGNGYFIHSTATYKGVVISRFCGRYDSSFSHGRRVYS